MERYVITYEPKLDLDEVLKKTAVTEEEDIAFVRGLCREASAVARPKALYKVCYVDGIEGDRVTIDGIAFTSRTLARNLADVHRVYAYIVTCGAEIDEWAHDPDFVAAVWKDMLKEMLLRAAVAEFNRDVRTKYKAKKMSGMNPGSGNTDTWPIVQQKELFALIGEAGEIGVSLTDSCLMVPNKSVSGILFVTDSDYVNCAVCRRERCPNRMAEYNPEMDV